MTDVAHLVNMFTRARYAAWAGDFEHCRALLIRVQKESPELNEREQRWDSVGLLQHATDELLVRVVGDATTIAGKSSGRKSRTIERLAFDDAFVISTEHLRGRIHRLDLYHFELRAYLDDLSWESNFHSHALSVARGYGTSMLSEQEERLTEPDVRKVKSKAVGVGRKASSYWRIVGNNVLREVSVGPLCLIRVTATWMVQDPPKQFAGIKAALEEVLKEIENGRPS
jgi:hypothetical protein